MNAITADREGSEHEGWGDRGEEKRAAEPAAPLLVDPISLDGQPRLRGASSGGNLRPCYVRSLRA